MTPKSCGLQNGSTVVNMLMRCSLVQLTWPRTRFASPTRPARWSRSLGQQRAFALPLTMESSIHPSQAIRLPGFIPSLPTVKCDIISRTSKSRRRRYDAKTKHRSAGDMTPNCKITDLSRFSYQTDNHTTVGSRTYMKAIIANTGVRLESPRRLDVLLHTF